MADNELQRLEREYKANGVSVLPALNRARRRVGLPVLREKTIHYVTADVHYRIDTDGKFNPRFGHSSVYALCKSTEVWPRQHQSKHSKVYYTAKHDEVTCKTCDKMIKNPDFREKPAPTHMRVAPEDRSPYTLCGAAMSLLTSLNKTEISCPTCKSKFSARPDRAVRPRNARDRRRERRKAERAALVSR
jgi:hypothetical protein